MQSTTRRPGMSPEVMLTMSIGGLLLVYGLVALLLGGHGFAADFPDGTVGGEKWLGIEGNAWTNLLFMASGALLIAGSPRRVAAKATAFAVALVLGAASVIAIADGDDVLGIFAANGGTMAAWGFAAVALLVIAAVPRRNEPASEPDWQRRDDQRSDRFGRLGEPRTTDRTPHDRAGAGRRPL